MKTRKQAILATITACVLIGTPTSASATQSVTPPPIMQEDASAGLTETGEFDVAVAEANGFKIVTKSDGTKESVPVTPSAVAEQERANRLMAETPTTFGEANMGTCGKSWITASKGANDKLTVKTGFKTYMTANSYTWTIVASALVQSAGFKWTGGAVSSSGWSATSTKTAVGPGVAQLRLSQLDSYVLLVNGTKCQNSIPGPMDTFS